jgi:hypothetical protein
MQNNDPYTRLEPSASWVARDKALGIVQMLESLQSYSEGLMELYVGWCRTGNAPTLSDSSWLWLVQHELMREDDHLHEWVRDVVRTSVSGDSAPFTIDGSMY